MDDLQRIFIGYWSFNHPELVIAASPEALLVYWRFEDLLP